MPKSIAKTIVTELCRKLDPTSSFRSTRSPLVDIHSLFISCFYHSSSVRCGLSGKNKLSYEKFLSAFQDNRHAGYGRVTLETPGKVVTPVVFERHDSLSPEASINRLRNKISENPETIQRVSNKIPVMLFCVMLQIYACWALHHYIHFML